MNRLTDAIRQLRRRPGFSALVIVVVAVGIGVNVAMYSLLEHMLLRPLPAVPEPERLVNLMDPGPDVHGPVTVSMSGGNDSVFSYPMFRDLERAQEPFVGIAAHKTFRVNLSRAGRVRRVEPCILVERIGGNSQILGRSLIVNGVTSVAKQLQPRSIRFIAGS